MFCPKIDLERPPPTKDDFAAAGTRSIHTMDGRIVEYSVHGSSADDARVVVNPYVAVPAGLTLPYEQSLLDLNLKEINISLPGLGLSEIQREGTNVSDWPRTDVEPVLTQELVQGEFYAYGGSLGSIYALSMAQYFGDRLAAVGFRAPFVPLVNSKEAGLPNGQTSFPSTKDLNRNSTKARCCKGLWSCILGTCGTAPPANLVREHPDFAHFSAEYGSRALFTGHYKLEALLYALARDVVLEAPGLDVKKVQMEGDRVVVWWGSDDEDCPPSHGKWLADHFKTPHRRELSGFGHEGAAGCVDHTGFLTMLMNAGSGHKEPAPPSS